MLSQIRENSQIELLQMNFFSKAIFIKSAMYLVLTSKCYILPPFFLDVTLSILGSFKLDVTLLFWVITSLFLSPITCSHGTLLLFILSISLLSKNYLEVRDLKSVTSNKKRRKYLCWNF